MQQCTFTGDSLNNIKNMEIPKTQSYYELFKAREHGSLAFDNYKNCTSIFKFNEKGDVNFIDSVSSAFKSVITGFGESALSSLMRYNSVMSQSLGYAVNREEHTYTETDENGETIEKTDVDYNLVSTGAGSWVKSEDSHAFFSFGLFLVSLAPPLQIGSLILTATTMNDAGNACKEYGINYITMWNYLYKALINDTTKAENTRIALISAYENASYAGMCNTNYTLYGLNECLALKEELVSLKTSGKELYFVQSNLTDLEYSEIPKPENVFYISSNVENFSKRAEGLINNYTNAYERAINYIRDKQNQLTTKRNEIQQLINQGNEQKLYLIDAIAIKGNVDNTQNINDQFEQLKQKLNLINADISAISYLLNNKPQDYMLRAYEITKKADIYTLTSDIMDKASLTVDETRKMAVQKIDELQAKGYETKELRNKLYESDTKRALGDKYIGYKEIINRASLMTLSPPKNKDQFEKIYNELLELFEKARADGIETRTYERTLSNIYNSEDSYVDKYRYAVDLKASFLNNVKQRFSSLSTLKAELDKLLITLSYQFTDIVLQKNNLESKVFSRGVIDYEKGLGNLLELENFYKSSIARITQEAKILFNNAPLKLYINKPKAKIDEKAIFEANFFVTNPYNIKLENVEKQIPLNLDLYTIDYSLDRGVLISGRNITWKIPYIESYETLNGMIKKEVIASSISKYSFVYSKNEEGKEINNYTIVIDTDMIIDLDCNCDLYIGSFYAGKRSTYEFKKGTYSISIIKPIKAVEIRKEHISCLNVENGSLCKYTLNVKALTDINKLELTFENNATVLKDMQKMSLNNNNLVINDIKEETELTFSVSYLINDVSQYLKNLIKTIESKNITKEEQKKLEEIKTMNNSGFYNEALLNALNLSEQINKRLLDEQKDIEKASVSNALKEEILSAINVNSSITNDIINFNKSLNYSNEKEIDKNKKLFVKDELSLLWKDFTEIQKDYYSNSNQSEEIEKKFLEFENLHRQTKFSNNIEDLAKTSKLLDEIKDLTSKNRYDTTAFESLYKNTQELMLLYENLEKRAKDLKLNSYISIPSSYFKEKLKGFSNLKTARQKSLAFEDLKNLQNSLNTSINDIAAVAERELQEAENMLKESNLPESTYKTSLEKAKEAFDKKDYMLVLYTAKQMKDNLMAQKFKPAKEFNIIPYAALFIIAVASALYLYRDKLYQILNKKDKPKKVIKKYEDIENEREAEIKEEHKENE